jgi:hypothetical protein
VAGSPAFARASPGRASPLPQGDRKGRGSPAQTIGQDADLSVGGDVTVQATHLTSSQVSATAISSGAGALVAVDGADANATDNGAATAKVGSGTAILANGTVQVFSTVDNNAEADTNTLSIGLVAVGGQQSITKVDGTADANSTRQFRSPPMRLRLRRRSSRSVTRRA